MRIYFCVFCCFVGGLAAEEPLVVEALTFNIRYDNPKDGANAWPKRKAMVGEWLVAEKLDVIGLQEALRHQIDDISKAAPLKLVDTFRVVHPDEEMVRTGHGFKGGVTKGGKIDHVFVLPGTADVESAAIVRYNRDGRYLSDHFPVRASLLLR
jgi:endonuclease/exonuclease/phosphatase family metal-dependent hydrolase